MPVRAGQRASTSGETIKVQEKVKYKSGSREDARQAKERILFALEQGMTVADACKHAHRSEDAWKRYKESDPDFRARAENILSRRSRQRYQQEVPDFPEFCEKYLGMKLFTHQLQWFDLLEGREPRDLHPAQVYVPGSPQNIVINTPPGHAKSTTITLAYVMWRIVKDQNVKIMLISKSQTFAANFLYSIKTMMTSTRYGPLQSAFAPADGWERSATEWAINRIRLKDDQTDAEKDPTVQVLGIGGQIYGSRSDLIIVDDAVVLGNVAEWEKQLRWIRQEVDSRLYSDESKLLVVGTRVAPVDLYSALLDDANYDGEESPWTYLTQPAILENDGENIVTLWPRSNQKPRGYKGDPGEDGLYPKWDKAALDAKRRKVDARTWALVYQQEQVTEEAIFPEAAVRGCIDRTRNPGRMVAGLPGHPRQGQDGMYIVAGMDPAAVGFTAAVALALDRDTGRRYVLDVHNQARMTPDQIRNLIYDWTAKLGIQEWRIEQNAFQAFLVQDREIGQWLAARGVMLAGHLTGRNKTDPEFGVASMATLFRGWGDGNNLIHLPSNNHNWPSTRAMVEQLVTYFPETKAKTDIVMAMWFAELRARELVLEQAGAQFRETRWLSQRQLGRREIVDMYGMGA